MRAYIYIYAITNRVECESRGEWCVFDLNCDNTLADVIKDSVSAATQHDRTPGHHSLLISKIQQLPPLSMTGHHSPLIKIWWVLDKPKSYSFFSPSWILCYKNPNYFIRACDFKMREVLLWKFFNNSFKCRKTTRLQLST